MRSPLPENDAKEISIGSSLDEVEKEPSLDLTKKHSADTNDNFDYADRRDDKAELSKIEKKLLYFFIGFSLLCILSLGLLTAKMFADEISMQKIQQSLDENSLKWVNLKEELQFRDQKWQKTMEEQFRSRDDKWRKVLNQEQTDQDNKIIKRIGDQIRSVNQNFKKIIKEQLGSRDQKFTMMRKDIEDLNKMRKKIDDLNTVSNKIKDLEERFVRSKKQLQGRIQEFEYFTKDVNPKLTNLFHLSQKHQKYISLLKTAKSVLIDYFITLEKNSKTKKTTLFQLTSNLTIAQKIQLPINTYLCPKILYQSEEIVNRRQAHNEARLQFFSRYFNDYPELKIAKYTLQAEGLNLTEQTQDLNLDYKRLEAKYNLSLFKQELPMCIIMTGQNNNDRFRIEYALNSVFLQNYSNYHAIVVDDSSNDGSQDIYRRYVDFYQIKEDKGKLVLNSKRVSALENILNSVFNHCKKEQIGILIDGDDEFLGRNVLTLFNSFYQKRNYGFVYSKYLVVKNKKEIIITASPRLEYTRQMKDHQLYRDAHQDYFFSHIKTCRIDLFYQIDLEDLKDSNGSYFKRTSDKVLFYPIAELSCGEVQLVQELNYLYNIQTGINAYVDHQYQQSVERIVKSKAKYPCSKLYGSYKSRSEKNRIETEKQGKT